MGVWTRRLIAAALAAVGAAAPVMISLATRAPSPQTAMLWSSVGLVLVVLAVAFFEWSERSGVTDRIASWEPAVQQMRGAGLRLEQMQRRLSEIDENTAEIRGVKHLLNEERHNLSLVASGMVEIRGIIDTERANLGTLAAGVHEVRLESDRRTQEGERLSAEVSDFAEIVKAMRSHLDALSSKLATLEERSVIEQQNLGLVAAGLDGIRRSASGVERFDARQSAFEDALLSISDSIDALHAERSPHNEAA